EQ
ncbi:hypothetical protein D037_0075B, partial [Vibrio parahaemolyticus IDH02640]